MSAANNDETIVRFAGMRFSLSDVLKLVFAIIAVAAGWFALSAKVDTYAMRLDSDEKQQAIYLRADVQAVRDAAMLAQIQALKDLVNQRFDELQNQIDGPGYQKRGSVK